jgi:hypothetical protein
MMPRKERPSLNSSIALFVFSLLMPQPAPSEGMVELQFDFARARRLLREEITHPVIDQYHVL